MGMQKYIEARHQMIAYPDAMDFAGPRSEELVRLAEGSLGFTVPQPYRQFLLDFGAGGFGAFEVYGLIDANFIDSGVPNGIWYTLLLRREAALPLNMIVIGSDGMGDILCLRNQRDTYEADVVLYSPGLAVVEQGFELIATDFGEYFYVGVMRQISKLAKPRTPR